MTEPEKPGGRLVVVCGPSGVGKGTVIKEILRKHPDMWLSVSATTRLPRPGEHHGVNYYFLTNDEFDGCVAHGEMLEHAAFAGNRYGTLAGPVNERIQQGATVLLEIEVEGAKQVRDSGTPATFLFLLPPSREELERRLRGRGTEGEQEVRARLQQSLVELEASDEFDHVIVNDDIARTVGEIERLLGLDS